ncbi:hypothetical protein [Streptomonospora litoralis]|uniref:Uncharacterized protein n=1 Tax=Streptomonospora litoralis TaxID=2498135 RepID=A0A4P6PY12_9ACTN|nr:hypothetical protein [Streptomonospora litoralis]QBI53035.1 hypothetical protein EKD16_06185 [Streptomonospora litoralis]
MARISPERPARPSWCGDRIHAVSLRLQRDHDLDVAVVWPHLWLILLPETATAITATRRELTRAIGLTAWAVLYLPLAAWWWPASLVTAALAVLSWHKTRMAADTYATLIEATVRLNVGDLADRLGIEHTGLLTVEVGGELTRRLQPSLPPSPAKCWRPGAASCSAKPCKHAATSVSSIGTIRISRPDSWRCAIASTRPDLRCPACSGPRSAAACRPPSSDRTGAPTLLRPAPPRGR